MREHGKNTESYTKMQETALEDTRGNSLNLKPEGWSGRPDLNWGPLGPEPSALPGYATPRQRRCQGAGARCQEEATFPWHLIPGTCFFWSGRADLNCRPVAPQASALPGCATSRPHIIVPAQRGSTSRAQSLTLTLP